MTTQPPRDEHERAHGALADLRALDPDRLSWRLGRPQLPSVDGGRPAAVLILLGVLDDVPAEHRSSAVPRSLDVLLQRRSDSLSSHPGQVSFPGGRAEPHDADAAATAMREAQEETGLDPAGVEVLHTLPDVPLVVSDHRVSPVVAWWREPSAVAAVDHAETVDVRRVPIADLLDPESRFMTVHDVGGSTLRMPAFEVDGMVVWGFTAGLLDGLLDALGWTEPWDTSRERAL